MSRPQTRAACPECGFVDVGAAAVECLSCPDHGQFAPDDARWAVTA